MNKIIVFGTFDIFHEGHRDFLKQTKRHGDFLRVVVARDANVEKIKGRIPKNNERIRMAEIIKSALADEVVLGSPTDKYDAIKEYKPNVICLGYDQKVNMDELKKVLRENNLEDTEIIKLKPYMPEKYKSSIILKSVQEK